MSQNHARTSLRPPVWLWVVAGALTVGLAATAALLLSNRGGGPEPEAEVVTLALPTPSVSAIERESGTAFYDMLPTTVLGFALSASGPAPDLMAAGALEAYQLDYTDGAAELVVQAGQWPDVEEAGTVFDAMVAEAGTPTDQGPVEVGGVEVGRWAMVGDGDAGTLLWLNETAVLRLDGPSDALRDVYAAFPL